MPPYLSFSLSRSLSLSLPLFSLPFSPFFPNLFHAIHSRNARHTSMHAYYGVMWLPSCRCLFFFPFFSFLFFYFSLSPFNVKSAKWCIACKISFTSDYTAGWKKSALATLHSLYEGIERNSRRSWIKYYFFISEPFHYRVMYVWRVHPGISKRTFQR